MHIADLYFRGFTNHPDRLALTGEDHGPDLTDLLAVTSATARPMR